MNLIILFEEDFTGPERVRLRGRRLQHVLAVHRARVGDALRVGALGGRIGEGVITALSAEALEMEVSLLYEPPAPLPLTLLLALPRPKSLRRMLQAVSAMGVKRLFLVNAWRVEKSFWDSAALAEPAVREQMILGLEQARDTILPRVELRRRFKPFVEDEVPGLVRGTRALLAHPGAPAPCPRGVGGEVMLAVGPEGGFIAYELDLLQARGFEAVSLGPRPLRVEHAVPALLGRLF